jgi:catecholate siderophore receptor
MPATRTIARSVPGYVRFDLTGSYSFNDHVELRVNVQNLTDKRYFDKVFTNHFAQEAAGRSAFATVTLRY